MLLLNNAGFATVCNNSPSWIPLALQPEKAWLCPLPTSDPTRHHTSHESFEPDTFQMKSFPDDLQSAFGCASSCLANFQLFLRNLAKILRFNVLSHSFLRWLYPSGRFMHTCQKLLDFYLSSFLLLFSSYPLSFRAGCHSLTVYVP